MELGFLGLLITLSHSSMFISELNSVSIRLEYNAGDQ